jgi:hypothetical protein
MPDRNRDVVESVPDNDFGDEHSDVGAEVVAGTLAAAEILGAEDFSDWEKKNQSK